MLDHPAYLTAQQGVRDLATCALPGAPIRPDPEAPATRGRHRLRQRAAKALVRSAARLDPGAAAAHGA
jgi:hypothetical protein